MFLKKDHRVSAVALAGAFAVLATGIYATGALTPARAVVCDTPPSLHRAQASWGDCTSALQCRDETVC